MPVGVGVGSVGGAGGTEPGSSPSPPGTPVSPPPSTVVAGSVPGAAAEAPPAPPVAAAGAGAGAAASPRTATEGAGDRVEGDDDEPVSPDEMAEAGPDAPRDSVVARLTRRLTDFVRTHEDTDAADQDENAFLHNEDVDADPESTGDAREAADTLRRRSRILRLARLTRDDPLPGEPTDQT